jgi:hypothetical protein
LNSIITCRHVRERKVHAQTSLCVQSEDRDTGVRVWVYVPPGSKQRAYNGEWIRVRGDVKLESGVGVVRLPNATAEYIVECDTSLTKAGRFLKQNEGQYPA